MTLASRLLGATTKWSNMLDDLTLNPYIGSPILSIWRAWHALQVHSVRQAYHDYHSLLHDMARITLVCGYSVLPRQFNTLINKSVGL